MIPISPLCFDIKYLEIFIIGTYNSGCVRYQLRVSSRTIFKLKENPCEWKLSNFTNIENKNSDKTGREQPIVCKAAITWKAGKGFSIETVEVAVPKKGEVRVQVKSSGLCHTDVHMMEGVEKDWPFPSVLGHEGAGIVESIGEGVTDFAPGDIVVFLFEGYCGNCDYCKDSRTNMCRHQPRNQLQRDGTSRFSCKGKEISQLFSLGTFSEFTVVSVCNITKVNPKANPNTLCLVGCCIPTGYGAVINAGKVPAGATCAVWGLGGVGLCVLMGCRDSGASKIIGVDTNSDKFSVAKEFGATEVLDPKEVGNVPEKIAEMTNGGADFCFASVGNSETMEEAFMSSHPYWGKTIIIGLGKIGEKMKAGIWELLYGRVLTGTFYGCLQISRWTLH
ncbi:alcohol dehydrogenase class-3-like [Argiope bruennichi]|uniref:alcohol dehydrogenase class-3-like n=1 Tax=Argiope bruennichi TaxID=94029 RepID=UPI002494DB19|nr:alcohol dehydrogenase class-3-like [Argiope bruennichi]